PVHATAVTRAMPVDGVGDGAVCGHRVKGCRCAFPYPVAAAAAARVSSHVSNRRPSSASGAWTLRPPEAPTRRWPRSSGGGASPAGPPPRGGRRGGARAGAGGPPPRGARAGPPPPPRDATPARGGPAPPRGRRRTAVGGGPRRAVHGRDAIGDAAPPDAA